jgi:GNAT superfamily N-acetyltransferase
MSARFEMQSIGPDDLARLAAVDARMAIDPARKSHIGELLGYGLSWAAVEAGDVVGFAVVTRHFYGFPFVDLVVVADAARRRGAGSALMAHCEAMHDADRIFTSTNESNEPMRALLSKAGWLPAGVVHYLDPGDPELIFVKPRA